MPGKTCESNCRPKPASLQRIRPPRGPRRVLWVVKVTKSAWGTGLGWSPAGHESGDVGDVREQHGADLGRDHREPFEVDDARVGAGADGDHLRAGAPGQAASWS